MKTIYFKLNNEKISLDVEPTDILLNVLRDKLGVKSPKCGCDRGDCGACTVLLNAKTVRSCLVLAIEVDGMEILSLEGLQGEIIDQLQKKFLSYNSFQCGYCAPGIIVSAVELLKKKSQVSKQEIKEALAGNLCRCTGYHPIINAIYDASLNLKKRKR